MSLVPSLSEALFALGLGDRVVGVTDWCVHPADRVADVAKVGGTKNPALDRIVELAPDLVIANQEENRERDVVRLRERGLAVWVTYPRGVREALAVLEELAGLGAAPQARAAVLAPIAHAVAQAEAQPRARRVRVVCPIWKRPWMVVGHPTYADDLLRLCGGENPFGDRRARRYPIVGEDELVAAAPEVILLPDEPYAFGARDVEELSALDLPAARSGRIHLLDGTLVSWYGPRMGRAIEEIGALLGAPGEAPGGA